jgi:hypothetical protein
MHALDEGRMRGLEARNRRIANELVAAALFLNRFHASRPLYNDAFWLADAIPHGHRGDDEADVYVIRGCESICAGVSGHSGSADAP